MTDSITLQPYQEEDSSALAVLFYETVRRVNIKDYTPAQVQAWAPAPPDPDVWHRSFAGHLAWVAWQAGEAVGFVTGWNRIAPLLRCTPMLPLLLSPFLPIEDTS